MVKITDRRLIMLDAEVFRYDWMFTFIDYQTKKKCVIVNDRERFKQFYEASKECIFIGYNNRLYDSVIFKAILLGLDPYKVSDALINQNKKGYQLLPKQHKEIQHLFFDCSTGFHSLKQLEAFLGMAIEESSVSFDIDRELTEEEIEEVKRYNEYDVLATIEVFEKRKSEFDAVVGLIEMFDLPHEYIGKTKAQISASILEAKKPDVERNDEWDIVLPENLKIKKYTDVVDWFLSDEIKKPNAKYVREVYGVEHTFALGGIHGATKKQKYDGIIALWDVASLYPSTIINYNLMSRNVANPKKYEEIRDLRLELKSKKDPRQAALKVCINATYGILKDKYSPMYDPRQANRICIYNQLFLLMLIESIEETCGESAQICNSNTDGLYIHFEDNHTFELAKEQVSKWEKITRYTMELEMAKQIIQRDVNNYILETDNKKIKAKGSVVKKLSPLDYDLPIVNKALKEYLINDTPLEDYINNETRLIEFQKIYKVTSNYKYAYHNNRPVETKVNRVFASTNENHTAFFKWKRDKTAPDKFTGTPEHCFIENGNIQNANTNDYPLDKGWYIKRAIDEYKKFTGKEYNQKVVKGMTDQGTTC